MLGTKKLKLIIVPTLITFVAFVILFRLGWWQLERAEQKQQQIAWFATQGEAEQLSLEAFVRSGQDPEHARVRLSGEVASDSLFYWDNRIKDGVVGYEVLAMLNSNVGPVMVNFGWLPATGSRAELPLVSLPQKLTGQVALLYQPKDNVFITETLALDSQWPKRLQQPDHEVMEQHTGESLLPFIAVLQEPAGTGLKNNYQPVVMPPEKHIAYAIQWFGLALAVLIVFYFAVKKKLNHDSE